MMNGLIFQHYTNSKPLEILRNSKWRKIKENCWRLDTISEEEFFIITNIHLPTVYIFYDTEKARTGYTISTVKWDYYLQYEIRDDIPDGVIFSAVVEYGDKKIINFSTSSSYDWIHINCIKEIK